MVFNRFMKELEEEQGAKNITFVHHKGGTGKTTSCLNIAGWLVKMKQKVLVVDLDPQGNATTGLGVDRKTLEGSIYEVLFEGRDIAEVVLETESGVQLVPSSIDLLAAEMQMAGRANNAGLLREKLRNLRKYFDYILIDVPPGSTLLMINGIAASGNIIIPLDAGVFAFETLETLKTLILDLSNEIGVEINVLMTLLREYPTAHFFSDPTAEVKVLVKDFLNSNGMSTVEIVTVPFAHNIYKSQVKGLPISHYAPWSDVGRVFKKIAKQLLRGE